MSNRNEHLVPANQLVPANVEAERSVLGGFILDNESFVISEAQCLTPDHFSLDSHRRIYRAILDLFTDNIPVDFQTLCSLLTDRKVGRDGNELEAVGGTAYILSLTDGLPRIKNLKHYIRILDDKCARRRAIRACNQISQRMYDQSEPPEKALDQAEKKFASIAADLVPETGNIFVDAVEFMQSAQEEVSWRVLDVIECGTSGFIIGPPKSGKSAASLYLAACLATGERWFDLAVRRSRVALVTREDWAGMTARRMAQTLRGMGCDPQDPELRSRLWINSRSQTKTLSLENVRDLNGLIHSLKELRTEFLILDVFNKLHSANENDNTEMRSVLNRVERIRDETGAQVCIVHHTRKNVEEGTVLSEIVRGAGAIGGFAEFFVGVQLVDEENRVRSLKVQTKSGEGIKPFYWRIHGNPVIGNVMLSRTDWEPPKRKKGGNHE